jgi:antagonist of KipI
MSVVVIRQGILDTIQDAGRYGYQHLGVNPDGCMDLTAASIANILVGNQRNEPLIELHFPASSFQFNEDCLIALSGADFQATVDDKPILINTAVYLNKGSILKFTHLNKGCRCYLSVHGGWEIESWANSYSTNLKASIGGYEGRALKKNDELKIKTGRFQIKAGASKIPLAINADVTSFYLPAPVIRCVPGSEFDWLCDEGKTLLSSCLFQISLQSDRMGYRLQGNNLLQKNTTQLLSSAVTRGTVQLLPSGQLIILMADHQTTGGYPKIAHVISSDFGSLAQMRPNEKVRFQIITHKEAEDAYLMQQQLLDQLEHEVLFQFKELIEAGELNFSIKERYEEDKEFDSIKDEDTNNGSSKSPPQSPMQLIDTDKRISSSIYLDTPASGTTKKVIYSVEDKILEVELKGGRIYQYLSFPFKEWMKYKDEIASGKSSGQFYNYVVKKYDYREVKLNK